MNKDVKDKCRLVSLLSHFDTYWIKAQINPCSLVVFVNSILMTARRSSVI